MTVVDLGELDQRTVLRQYKVLAEHLYPNISLIVRSHYSEHMSLQLIATDFYTIRKNYWYVEQM